MKAVWVLIQADRRWLLGIGVGLALLHLLCRPLPDSLQWGYFIGSVFLTGIPHGALDHLVVAGTDARHHRAFSMVRFLSRYVLLMAAYALVWWQWPGLALLGFMLCSAYHFGETDLVVLAGGSTPLDRLVYLCYGWLLVSFLALAHPGEAWPILAQLPGITTTPTRVMAFVEAATLPYALGCGLLALLVLLYTWRTVGPSACWVLIVQSVGLAAIITTLPLLLAFTFYFAWWHAGLSLRAIRRYVVDATTPTENAPNMTWLTFVRRAGLFSALAIGGMLCFILIGRQYASLTDLLPAFLVGIAVLTLPHMTVMSTLFTWLRTTLAASPPSSPLS